VEWVPDDASYAALNTYSMAQTFKSVGQCWRRMYSVNYAIDEQELGLLGGSGAR
jgi:hypothetical protein